MLYCNKNASRLTKQGRNSIVTSCCVCLVRVNKLFTSCSKLASLFAALLLAETSIKWATYNHAQKLLRQQRDLPSPKTML